MAIVQNPVTNATSGSFGNAVFTKKYGKKIIRSKPLNFKDAKTPLQLTGRNKFRILVAFIQQVLPVINQAYAGILTDMYPFNKALSLNLKTAFTGDPPVLDHTKVVLCDTEGSTVSDVVLTTHPDQVVNVEWTPNTKNKWDLSSSLTFIIINTSTNEAIIIPGIELRSIGVVHFTVPKSWVGCMTALHIMTSDSSKLRKGLPKIIIKFAAGVDEASIIH